MSISGLVLGKPRQYILRWLGAPAAAASIVAVAGIQQWFQEFNLVYLIVILHFLEQVLQLLQIRLLGASRLLRAISAFLRQCWATLCRCWWLFTTREPSVCWQSVLILILELETSILIKAVVRYLGFGLCFVVFVVASQLVDERLGHWVQRSHLIWSDCYVDIV